MLKAVLEKLPDKGKSPFVAKNTIILPGLVSSLEKLYEME
jgi:hypothetical protein